MASAVALIRPSGEVRSAGMSSRVTQTSDSGLPEDLDWPTVEALSARYALGEPEIDAQHRILFAWYVALKRARDVRPILEGLRQYAGDHFTAEETWAQAAGVLPETHMGMHLELLVTLDEILLRPKPSRTATMSLAYDWLVQHIDVEDRALVEAVRNACPESETPA